MKISKNRGGGGLLKRGVGGPRLFQGDTTKKNMLQSYFWKGRQEIPPRMIFLSFKIINGKATIRYFVPL